MTLWRGRLCNTRHDIVLDSALALALVAAFIIQSNRLRTERTTRGVSPYFILANAIFSNSQLSVALLNAAYAWPNDARPILSEIAHGHLAGTEAFGGLLGLTQIFVQRICSIAMVIQYAVLDSEGSARRICIITLLHVAVFLYPSVKIALPKPSSHNFGMDVLMAFIMATNAVIAPCSAMFSVYAQYQVFRALDGDTGALSTLSLIVHASAMVAPVYRLLIRAGPATFERLEDGPGSISEWYQCAMAPINYTLHALGYVALVFCYKNGEIATGVNIGARAALNS